MEWTDRAGGATAAVVIQYSASFWPNFFSIVLPHMTTGVKPPAGGLFYVSRADDLLRRRRRRRLLVSGSLT